LAAGGHHDMLADADSAESPQSESEAVSAS